MKVSLSVIVNDQAKALEFYTEVLGFVLKTDLPAGDNRWLTIFQSVDIPREYERLRALGVAFRQQPTQMGAVTLAIFDDTCGNWIQLHQA